MDRSNINRQHDPSLPQQQQQQPRKKCHGNRRDQRFRRKCREEKMKPSEIKKLLKKRNAHMKTKIQIKNNIIIRNNDPPQTTISNQTLTDRNTPMLPAPAATTNTMTSNITRTTFDNLNKRKRDISIQDFKTHPSTVPKSTSSLSIAAQRPSLKKQKMTMINNSIHMNYRQPMYLKRSSIILFQMLNKTLNYTFKIKNEKDFIYTRIDLLDQQYCLEVHQQLWKSYLDLGMEKHLWPTQLQQMAKSNDFKHCQQYLINYLETIKTELNKYQIELNKQKQSCSIANLPIEQIDHCLKQFVDCQRQYLLTRNNNELMKFKDYISGENSIQSISIQYQFTTVESEFIQQLMIIRQQEMKIWEELLMLEMRILCNFLPLNFNQMETFIVPLSYSPIIKEQKAIHFNNKHYKIIQEGKRNWLNIFFNTYDIKLEQYEQQYENKFLQLSNNITTINNSSILMNKIQEHMIYQTNKFKQEISQKMSNFRRKLLKHRQHSSTTTKTTVGVSPEPYIDLYENPFNICQWNQLSLGPSFIRLNQTTNRPQDQQKTEINKHYKDIKLKVTKHLTSYPHSVSLTSPYFKQYEHHLLTYLNHCYFAPISYKDQMQSLEQLHITSTIRKTIKQNNLILRVTDKGHNFYIGSAIEFEKKVQKFFQDTQAFKELTENPFNQIQDKAIELLNHLRQKGSISKEQYDEMVPDRSKTELAHLYFNPKTHKDGIPVRPIESTIHASTTNISKFLDKTIRPIFNEKCQQTNIIDGNSFLNETFKYATKKGVFKSSTLFCTFDIRNLYTMLPQEDALNTLVDFLYTHGYRDVQGIPLDTIRKLASFVIKENVFAYGNKIYQQVIGGAMGSSFTLTLANIFMWKWQKELVRQQDITCEFYGRYIDDVFMTWNKSEKDLIKLLDQANICHPNIKLDYKIGKSLPYLDILLTNNNGILSTSVYHKPAAEPYVVPFLSDHPRHVFINIIQNSLKHALKYSSTFEAFNHERRYIKLMLLYNGYPSSFIENQFRKFFHEYISSTSLLPFITDEKQFQTMRHKLLTQPANHQTQIESNTITSNLPNVPINDGQQNTTTAMVQSNTEQNKEDNKSERKLYIHHQYEKRFRNMKRGLHQVHKDIFNQSASKNVKMTVGNLNRRNATHELIRKRPSKSLLKNKPRQKKKSKAKKLPTANTSTIQLQAN